jgi:hypothetical protein
MFQLTVHTVLRAVFLLLALAAGRDIIVQGVCGWTDATCILEQSSDVSVVPRHGGYVEILSSVHHLTIVIDVVETTETRSEDDDNTHAHNYTTVPLHDSFSEKSLTSSTLAGCSQAVLIPLYILHHSWKHFVSSLPA